MTGAPPKVFISYSHDTVEHQKRVLGLANRLRADGVDAEVDQYNAAPPEGWPLWCERQIAAADVVLMVCTATYYCRVSGDKGLGAVWEARIIRQLLYDAGAVGDKFVPVLFSDASPDQIPTPIKGGTRYVVDTEGGYEELYRRLTGQPRLLRPALGTIRALPTRRRQWPEGTMKAASSSPNLRATQETGGRMEPVSGNQEADMGEKTGEGQSGGVNIAGTVGSVGGDIVGRDKIVGVPSAAALDDALRPLIEAIGAAPAEVQAEAEAKLAALKQEAAKGKDANDGVSAKLVDGLVGLVPGAASAMVSAFATPILGGIAGPVTGFVLDKLRSK
jgi:SEFIR domain